MRLKRVLGAVLSGAMVLSLAACGGGGDAETTAASKAEETSKEAAKETEAEKKDDAKETEAAKGGEEINKRIAYVVGNLGDSSSSTIPRMSPRSRRTWRLSSTHRTKAPTWLARWQPV